MATLTKGQILAANDTRVERVNVPEWGGDLILRSLTAAELDEYEASVMAGEDADYDNVRARFLVRCIVDDQGQPLFGLDEAPILGEKCAAVVDRLYAIASKMNKRTKADLDALVKNSAAGRKGSSRPASPAKPASAPINS